MTATTILIPVRPCNKCGTCERYANGKCKFCHKASSATYRNANTEKAKAATAKWRAANVAHKQAYASVYYEKNREKIKLKSAKWRAENPEKAKLTCSAWNLKNPNAKRLFNQNRRALRAQAGGKLSVDISEKLFKLQKGKCSCCKQPLGDDYHIDHIMPLALGGTNTDDNIQLLRKTCNLRKNMKHPVDSMQSRGFLL